MEDLIKIIERTRSTIAVQITDLGKEVDRIIAVKVTDTQTIERMLDTLLDCGQLGLGEQEFRRLNAYYATIKQEYAQRYEELYTEMKTES